MNREVSEFPVCLGTATARVSVAFTSKAIWPTGFAERGPSAKLRCNSGLRATRPAGWSGLREGVAGQGEEHIVQGGAGQLNGEEFDLGRVQGPHKAQEQLIAVVDGQAQDVVGRIDFADGRVAGQDSAGGFGRAFDFNGDDVAGDAAFEFVGRSLGDEIAVVDDQDAIAE